MNKGLSVLSFFTLLNFDYQFFNRKNPYKHCDYCIFESPKKNHQRAIVIHLQINKLNKNICKISTSTHRLVLHTSPTHQDNLTNLGGIFVVMTLRIASFLLLSVSLFSCVSKKQYQSLEVQKDSISRICENDRRAEIRYRDSIINVVRSVELAMETQRLKASALTDSLQICQRQVQENKVYLESLGESMTEKQRKLAQEIELKNKAIANKELELNDALAEAEKERLRLQTIRKELELVSQRVIDLEAELRSKDSAVLLLKEAILNALAGFEELDIKVEYKNGKVYVILPEKLLFKSGSTQVDPKGVEALLQIAKALNEKNDVQIGVEGHTDNVPMKESDRMKDNWDLSVLRATSISRILFQQGGIKENRIAAIGRGATMPIASNDTPEGRAKNRRTEIILTPQLDKILDILNSK